MWVKVPHVKKLNAAGISLIEIVFATGVALLLIVSLVTLSSLSVRNAGFARNKAQATKYAQELMERVRAYRDTHGYANLVCTSSSGKCYIDSNIALSNSSATGTVIVGTIFSGYFSMPTPNLSCPANTKEVQVAIAWTEGSGPKVTQLTSCFSAWRSR